MYDDGVLKILAVMYGTGEGRAGSWNWASAVTGFSDELRKFASGLHFRPSESVPLEIAPQLRTYGGEVGF